MECSVNDPGNAMRSDFLVSKLKASIVAQLWDEAVLNGTANNSFPVDCTNHIRLLQIRSINQTFAHNKGFWQAELSGARP